MYEQDVDFLSHDAHTTQLATPRGGEWSQSDDPDSSQCEPGDQQQVQAARTRLKGV